MLFGGDNFDPAKDLSDLSGKVFIVTGGNAGLGYATVQHLVRHGAKVYMAARNEQKANDAIQKLKSEGLGPRNGEVVWHELDLSDARNAKKSAQAFMEREKRLDGLINNAAIVFAPYAKTHDDIQDIMMVNHVSPWVFTTTLLPLMKQTAAEPGSDVRIVNVSSAAVQLYGPGMRFRSRDDFNDERSNSFFPQMARYARSKLANVLFAKELQRRLDAENVPILVLSVNPGGVNTDGNKAVAQRMGPVLGRIYGLLTALFYATPTKGAYVIVFAAAAPVVRAEAQKYKGAYLQPPGKLGKGPGKDGENMDLARELWDTTEQLVKEIGM